MGTFDSDRRHGAGIPVLLLLLVSSASAADWSSCASDLDDLRRRADDASSSAQQMDSKAKRFKSAEEDLRNCSQFPEVYDLMRDRCYGKRSEYESQRSAYNSQLSDLRSKLEDVDYKIRSVNNSCGVSLTAALGPPPKVPAGVSRPDQCALYLRYKGSLPLQTIVDVCSKQMPADECRKCLQ